METNPNTFGQQPGSREDGKIAAIVSYFSIILWLISYFALHRDKKTDFGSYHLRQTLLFAIISTIIYILMSMMLTVLIISTGIIALVYLSYIAYIGLFVIWLIGFIGVIKGEKTPMPIIGERAQRMFPGI